MQQYADILTKGLRLKHRWFGGWDVGRRLPFIIISLITVQPSVAVVRETYSCGVHASVFMCIVVGPGTNTSRD